MLSHNALPLQIGSQSLQLTIATTFLVYIHASDVKLANSYSKELFYLRLYILLNEIADFQNLAFQLDNRNLSIGWSIGYHAFHKFRHSSTQFLLEGLIAVSLILVYTMEKIHILNRIDYGSMNRNGHTIVLQTWVKYVEEWNGKIHLATL
ncbi:unknown [Prevotella sp. CAG:1092]|nr:unknown [Prevotella sp. CAG:1092]